MNGSSKTENSKLTRIHCCVHFGSNHPGGSNRMRADLCCDIFPMCPLYFGDTFCCCQKLMHGAAGGDDAGGFPSKGAGID